MQYVDEFLGLKCAPLLLPLFPNAKEITESFAAYNAVRKYVRSALNIGFSDENVKVICVGDGQTPRTAATFATRSKWTAWSIDPVLNNRVWEIDRLVPCPYKVEFLENKFTFPGKKVILVCVHSHATLQNCLKLFNNQYQQLAIVTIPCCVPQELDTTPDLEYQDKSILSPENTVKIWLDY